MGRLSSAMTRLRISSQSLFFMAVVALLATSLMPASALRWTRLPAEILELAASPFADPLNRLSIWLRPAPMGDRPAGIDMEYVSHLEREMVRYEQLFVAEQAKVESLQEQLAQLQGFPVPPGKPPVHTIIANVAARSPSSIVGTVVLNLGSRHKVKPGAVAVYDHVHLIGRIKEVTAVQCVLLPLTNPGSVPIQAAVLPKDRTDAALSLSAAPKVHLDEARRDGTLAATPEDFKIINVGDEVVLIDPDWPESAQGMRIGVVESVIPDDTRPLRNKVVVRPRYQISQISSVVLRIDADPPPAEVEDAPP